MNWPTHTDYQDAIQNPHICFEDVTLKSGEVGCDMLGLPKVTSGNFACVYSLTADDGRFAIRCFVRQVLGQQGRYARLAQHLMRLGLDCMVDFEYILRGIKIANEWYPILKMQWVDGLPVNQYIDEYIDDPALLKQLVNNFPPIVEQLRANNLAHCDLQHGNIMVTPENEFKLVDYDGMFTTAFRGKSPELGHANFQHPRRTPDFYNEHVDNFGALVCYLSIMAIAENPDLFKKYYAADNLLLTANDYRNPKDSEVIKTLKSQDNEKVKQLATLLEKCCLVDVLQVPDFLEVVENLKTGEIANMVATGVSPTPAPAPAPAQAATGGGAAGGWWDQSTTESKPAGPVAPTTPQKTAAPATPSYLAGSTASRAPTPKTPSYANAARRPASPTPKTPPPSMRAEQPKPKAPHPLPTQIAPAGEDNNTQLLLIGAVIAGLVLLLIFMMAKAAS